MKFPTLLLAGSLVANAALVSLFVTSGHGDTTPSAAARITTPHSAAKDSNPEPETWANLQPADPAAMVGRLRDAGFPPAVVRALAADQIHEQFAPRRAALNLKEKERAAWEPSTHDPKTEAALRQIMQEEAQALKDVLAHDMIVDESAAADLKRYFPKFSDDQIAAIQRVNQRHAELRRAQSARSALDSSDVARLDQAREAELASLLPPQEFQDYLLRFSTAANTLRRRLTGFDPTEQEFRVLFQLQKTFDDRYETPIPPMVIWDPEAQKQLAKDIQAALGDQRYADYQRSLDSDFQETSKLVARLELPSGAAKQVYALQQDLQQRAAALRTLPLDQRNAQLAALAAEAQTKVTATLGPRGYEAYKQYGGGWLQSLQPRR